MAEFCREKNSKKSGRQPKFWLPGSANTTVLTPKLAEKRRIEIHNTIFGPETA
jgi:hypothetical protein